MKGNLTNARTFESLVFEKLLNPKHPLYLLAELIPWKIFEEKLGYLYDSKKGRPGIPIRVMVGLMFLKYLMNLSDEDVIVRFVENIYMQRFCGMKELSSEPPANYTSLVKFRKRMKNHHYELFLKVTCEVGLQLSIINKKDLNDIIVDTTVQEKNITYPTDAKLYFKLIKKLRELSEAFGIKLKQSFKRKSKEYLCVASRNYMKRGNGKKAVKKLKTCLGRLMRDLIKKLADDGYPEEVVMIFDPIFKLAERLMEQEKDSKNKLYSIHEPAVACIAKGKHHKKYEFGNPVGFATTHKNNFIIGCESFEGNPNDSKTLKQTIASTVKITEKEPDNVFVDNGYSGHNYNGTAVVYLQKQMCKEGMPAKKYFKRRAAIEPIIGHMKNESRLGRNYLLGINGNKLNAILSAASFNLRKIINHLTTIFTKKINLQI